MKFKYKKYGSDILRPVIRIEISYGSINVPYSVLVDSGADICIFDADIAAILGIDITKGIRHEVAGLTGVPQYYYLHRVSIIVGGISHRADVGFMKMNNQSFGIVGQKGFFDKFIVKFDLEKEEIELKERE